MKAISASIIALAGTVLLAAGLTSDDTDHALATIAGALLVMVGLITWAIKFLRSAD